MLQYTGKVRDDEYERAYDEAEQHDVLRHRRAVFILANLIEEFPDFR